MLKMIVAHDTENGIGKNNKLPWYIPQELSRFSCLTRGNGNNAIIMGRKTYESIGKTLPKRTNIVLSKKKKEANNCFIFSTKKEITQFLNNNTFDDIWIIGGAFIYKEFLDIVDELYVTEINESFKCDTFFPLNYQQYFNKCVVEKMINSHNGYDYIYKKYFR
tara:strand:- start:3412 stop:3900 length:489 start_codon:yes stop_codon:yes gene_type:complete